MGSAAGTRVGGGGRFAGPGRRHRGAGGRAHLYVENGSRAPRDGAGGPAASGGGTAARHLQKGWRTTVDRSGVAAGRGTGTRADTVRQPLRPRSRHTGSGRSSTRELHPCIGDRSEEQTGGERCDASTAACGVGGGYARGVKRKPIAIMTPRPRSWCSRRPFDARRPRVPRVSGAHCFSRAVDVAGIGTPEKVGEIRFLRHPYARLSGARMSRDGGTAAGRR